MNFFVLPIYNSIIFLYEKGDLFIIPIKYIESKIILFYLLLILATQFQEQWKIIKLSLEQNPEFNLDGIIRESIKSVLILFI